MESGDDNSGTLSHNYVRAIYQNIAPELMEYPITNKEELESALHPKKQTMLESSIGRKNNLGKGGRRGDLDSARSSILNQSDVSLHQGRCSTPSKSRSLSRPKSTTNKAEETWDSERVAQLEEKNSSRLKQMIHIHTQNYNDLQSAYSQKKDYLKALQMELKSLELRKARIDSLRQKSTLVNGGFDSICDPLSLPLNQAELLSGIEHPVFSRDLNEKFELSDLDLSEYSSSDLDEPSCGYRDCNATAKLQSRPNSSHVVSRSSSIQRSTHQNEPFIAKQKRNLKIVFDDLTPVESIAALSLGEVPVPGSSSVLKIVSAFESINFYSEQGGEVYNRNLDPAASSPEKISNPYFTPDIVINSAGAAVDSSGVLVALLPSEAAIKASQVVLEENIGMLLKYQAPKFTTEPMISPTSPGSTSFSLEPRAHVPVSTVSHISTSTQLPDKNLSLNAESVKGSDPTNNLEFQAHRKELASLIHLRRDIARTRKEYGRFEFRKLQLAHMTSCIRETNQVMRSRCSELERVLHAAQHELKDVKKRVADLVQSRDAALQTHRRLTSPEKIAQIQKERSAAERRLRQQIEAQSGVLGQRQQRRAVRAELIAERAGDLSRDQEKLLIQTLRTKNNALIKLRKELRAREDRAAVLQDAYTKIRSVTGVSSMDAMVERFLGYPSMREQLQRERMEAEQRLDASKDAYERSRKGVDMLRSSSDSADWELLVNLRQLSELGVDMTFEDDFMSNQHLDLDAPALSSNGIESSSTQQTSHTPHPRSQNVTFQATLSQSSEDQKSPEERPKLVVPPVGVSGGVTFPSSMVSPGEVGQSVSRRQSITINESSLSSVHARISSVSNLHGLTDKIERLVQTLQSSAEAVLTAPNDAKTLLMFIQPDTLPSDSSPAALFEVMRPSERLRALHALVEADRLVLKRENEAAEALSKQLNMISDGCSRTFGSFRALGGLFGPLVASFWDELVDPQENIIVSMSLEKKTPGDASDKSGTLGGPSHTGSFKLKKPRGSGPPHLSDDKLNPTVIQHPHPDSHGDALDLNTYMGVHNSSHHSLDIHAHQESQLTQSLSHGSHSSSLLNLGQSSSYVNASGVSSSLSGYHQNHNRGQGHGHSGNLSKHHAHAISIASACSNALLKTSSLASAVVTLLGRAVLAHLNSQLPLDESLAEFQLDRHRRTEKGAGTGARELRRSHSSDSLVPALSPHPSPSSLEGRPSGNSIPAAFHIGSPSDTRTSRNQVGGRQERRDSDSLLEDLVSSLPLALKAEDLYSSNRRGSMTLSLTHDPGFRDASGTTKANMSISSTLARNGPRREVLSLPVLMRARDALARVLLVLLASPSRADTRRALVRRDPMLAGLIAGLSHLFDKQGLFSGFNDTPDRPSSLNRLGLNVSVVGSGTGGGILSKSNSMVASNSAAFLQGAEHQQVRTTVATADNHISPLHPPSNDSNHVTENGKEKLGASSVVHRWTATLTDSPPLSPQHRQSDSPSNSVVPSPAEASLYPLFQFALEMAQNDDSLSLSGGFLELMSARRTQLRRTSSGHLDFASPGAPTGPSSSVSSASGVDRFESPKFNSQRSQQSSKKELSVVASQVKQKDKDVTFLGKDGEPVAAFDANGLLVLFGRSGDRQDLARPVTAPQADSGRGIFAPPVPPTFPLTPQRTLKSTRSLALMGTAAAGGVPVGSSRVRFARFVDIVLDTFSVPPLPPAPKNGASSSTHRDRPRHSDVSSNAPSLNATVGPVGRRLRVDTMERQQLDPQALQQLQVRRAALRTTKAMLALLLAMPRALPASVAAFRVGHPPELKPSSHPHSVSGIFQLDGQTSSAGPKPLVPNLALTPALMLSPPFVNSVDADTDLDTSDSDSDSTSCSEHEENPTRRGSLGGTASLSSIGGAVSQNQRNLEKANPHRSLRPRKLPLHSAQELIDVTPVALYQPSVVSSLLELVRNVLPDIVSVNSNELGRAKKELRRQHNGSRRASFVTATGIRISGLPSDIVEEMSRMYSTGSSTTSSPSQSPSSHPRSRSNSRSFPSRMDQSLNDDSIDLTGPPPNDTDAGYLDGAPNTSPSLLPTQSVSEILSYQGSSPKEITGLGDETGRTLDSGEVAPLVNAYTPVPEPSTDFTTPPSPLLTTDSNSVCGSKSPAPRSPSAPSSTVSSSNTEPVKHDHLASSDLYGRRKSLSLQETAPGGTFTYLSAASAAAVAEFQVNAEERRRSITASTVQASIAANLSSNMSMARSITETASSVIPLSDLATGKGSTAAESKPSPEPEMRTLPVGWTPLSNLDSIPHPSNIRVPADVESASRMQHILNPEDSSTLPELQVATGSLCLPPVHILPSSIASASLSGAHAAAQTKRPSDAISGIRGGGEMEGVMASSGVRERENERGQSELGDEWRLRRRELHKQPLWTTELGFLGVGGAGTGDAFADASRNSIPVFARNDDAGFYSGSKGNSGSKNGTESDWLDECDRDDALVKGLRTGVRNSSDLIGSVKRSNETLRSNAFVLGQVRDMQRLISGGVGIDRLGHTDSIPDALLNSTAPLQFPSSGTASAPGAAISRSPAVRPSGTSNYLQYGTSGVSNSGGLGSTLGSTGGISSQGSGSTANPPLITASKLLSSTLASVPNGILPAGEPLIAALQHTILYGGGTLDHQLLSTLSTCLVNVEAEHRAAKERAPSSKTEEILQRTAAQRQHLQAIVDGLSQIPAASTSLSSLNSLASSLLKHAALCYADRTKTTAVKVSRIRKKDMLAAQTTTNNTYPQNGNYPLSYYTTKPTRK